MTPRFVPTSIGDKTVGLTMVYAVQAPLLQQAHTGRDPASIRARSRARRVRSARDRGSLCPQDCDRSWLGLIGRGEDLSWDALDVVILAPGDHGEDHRREEAGTHYPGQPEQNHGQQQSGIAEIKGCYVYSHRAQP